MGKKYKESTHVMLSSGIGSSKEVINLRGSSYLRQGTEVGGGAGQLKLMFSLRRHGVH